MSGTDFLNRHSDWKNVYYDEDLREIRKTAKHLTDVLDVMEKRYNRHETVQIAKSVFDYVTQKEMAIQYPNQYYCFTLGDYKIAVKRVFLRSRRVDSYTVICLGFQPSYRFNQYRNEHGYFLEDTLGGIIPHFVDIVHEFTSNHLGSLF